MDIIDIWIYGKKNRKELYKNDCKMMVTINPIHQIIDIRNRFT